MSRFQIKSLNIPIFSQEYATEVFRKTTQEETWSEAWSKGALARAIATAKNLLRLGKLSEDDIADSVAIPVEEVRKIKAEMGKL